MSDSFPDNTLPENVKFQRARKLIRDALTEAKISPKIDALVANFLDRRKVAALPSRHEPMVCHGDY